MYALRLRKFAGFTLFEMLVVLIIAAFAVGLIVPRIGAGWSRMKDREFLSSFVHEMKNARFAAMRSGRAALFRIRDVERLYGATLPLKKNIPDNADIYAEGLRQDLETGDYLITFLHDGSAIGSDLEVILDNTRTYRICVNPLSGTVNFYKRTFDR